MQMVFNLVFKGLIYKPYITEKEKPNLKHITLKQTNIYDVQKVTHELVFIYFIIFTS